MRRVCGLSLATLPYVRSAAPISALLWAMISAKRFIFTPENSVHLRSVCHRSFGPTNIVFFKLTMPFRHDGKLRCNAGVSGRKKSHCAPVLSHSVRTMSIRSSILRAMEDRLELRLCSILSPVKKVSTNSARAFESIFGRSTSIFLAISWFSLALLRVTIATASGDKIGNSRIELTVHPCRSRNDRRLKSSTRIGIGARDARRIGIHL